MLTRETVTFRDAGGWSWEFDLTFMLSSYECIWGRGCPDTRRERTARAFGETLGLAPRDHRGREDRATRWRGRNADGL